jgi:hypothetical protein
MITKANVIFGGKRNQYHTKDQIFVSAYNLFPGEIDDVFPYERNQISSNISGKNIIQNLKDQQSNRIPLRIEFELFGAIAPLIHRPSFLQQLVSMSLEVAE